MVYTPPEEQATSKTLSPAPSPTSIYLCFEELGDDLQLSG